MRPRLAVLADLLGNLAGTVRARGERLMGRRPNRATEERSADEIKRRLDASRERLKRETPPSAD